MTKLGTVKVAAMVGAMAGVLASGEPDPDLWSMDLDELLEVPVSVASREDERVADAPSSVTVFTRTEIGNLGVSTLEELLNYVPGFSVARTEFLGQQWALSTRGFWGVSDPAVLLLVDGMRINEHFSGSFGLIDRLISLGVAERVEVIRGPGSALYGSNAFYGVVNIVTVRGENQVTAAAGELGAVELNANLSHEFGDNQLTGYLRFFQDDGEDYREIFDPFGLTSETRDPRRGADAYLSYARGGFRINLRHQSREFDDFHLLGNVANGVNRMEPESTGIFASYSGQRTERFSWNAWAGYDVLESVGFGRFAPQGAGPYDDADLLLGVYHQTRVANLGLDLRTQFGDHTLSYGLIWELADNPRAYQASNYDILTNEYLGEVTHQREPEKRFVRDDERSIAGIYLQEKYRPLEQLTLIGGVRLDDYNDFGETVNPRGAVIWRPGGGATLKLMYGEAFVAPTMEKLYLANNPFEVANPDLQPQEIRTTELAYTQAFSDVSATLTYFHNKETDLFILGTNPEGSFQTVNGGENSSRGLELEVAANLGSHVFLRATASRVLDGERPEAFTTLASLIVDVDLGRFGINLNACHRGEVDALPGQGSYTLLHSRLRYEILDALDVWLNVRNASDEKYLTYQRNGDGRHQNRGRESWLGLTYRF